MSFFNFRRLSTLLFLLLLAARSHAAQAQTAFSYTGKLASTINGNYDFKFTLYTDATAGSVVATPITISSVAVTNGSYIVTLDFGSTFFANAPLWMQIAYRVSGGTTFTNVKGRVLETSRFSLLSLLSENTLAIGGYPVSSVAPGNGQALMWNGSAWSPATLSVPMYSAGAGLSLNGNVFSIANAGVVSSMLAAGSVTAPAIAAGAVTSSAIASGAVTSSALAAGAVTTQALADGSVTAGKIAWPLSETLASDGALLSLTNTGNGGGGEFYGTGGGVYGEDTSGPGVDGSGVYGYSQNGNGGTFSGGYEGVAGGSGFGYGVRGFSNRSDGVFGQTSSFSSGSGVHGTSTIGNGVYGESYSGYGGVFYGGFDGVYAQSTAANSYAVEAHSYGDSNGIAVYGYSGDYGYGVVGGSEYGYGVYGSSPYGIAGGFDGDVSVTGTLTAGAKNFKIDHPLDPANKYLVHSCIESDQMADLYSGNVTTDANGEAIVTFPDWFEALNTDFRYQLTVIGQFAQAIISHEIHNHQFAIKTDKSNVKVSWQVTGIRQDAFAKAHPLEVEQDKPQEKKGKFLHPKELGYPESMGEDYAMPQRHAHLPQPPTSPSRSGR